MQLLKDVYLVAGTAIKPGQHDANAYLVDGGDMLVLIDSGTSSDARTIKAEMINDGFDPADIDMLLNTHAHFDHTGGNFELRSKTGLKTAIHHSEVEAIEQNTELTVAEIYGQELTPCPVDIALQGGEAFDLGRYKLEVIHTPGHTPGSVCFSMVQDGKTILFVGDALGLLGLPGEDAAQLAVSLQKLIDLRPDVILAGHEPGVVLHTASYLQEYADRLKDD